MPVNEVILEDNDQQHAASESNSSSVNNKSSSISCSIQPTSPMYMFEILLQSIRETKTLSDELLKELANLFPSTTLIHALELIDKEKVIKYQAKPSGRILFAVEPSHHHGQGRPSPFKQQQHTKKAYKCLSNNYCTCQSFAFSVLTRKESRYCKHLLAVILADALGSFKHIPVKDSEMGVLLLDED